MSLTISEMAAAGMSSDEIRVAELEDELDTLKADVTDLMNAIQLDEDSGGEFCCFDAFHTFTTKHPDLHEKA